MSMTTAAQRALGVPQFHTLTAVRLAVTAYEEEAERDRDLAILSASAVATFTGGAGRKGPNAFCLACLIDDHAWIAFRGSDDWTDWRKNLSFFKRQGVHRGFLGEWLKLRAQVLDWLKEHHADVQEINFSGHSLGGAIAMIGANEVFDLYPEKFGQIVTFGAPPPFYKSAAEAFARKKMEGQLNGEALQYRTLRVVNQRDIVSRLPGIVGLRHVGEMEQVGPPTFLAALGAMASRMVGLITGRDPWGEPPSYNPDDPASFAATQRWSSRERFRVFWRDGGFGIVRMHLMYWGSRILAPLWLTIYVVAGSLALILSIHRLFESGESHLRRNYLEALKPSSTRYKTMDPAKILGRR